MSNSPTGTANYTPRMTDLEAYEKLPPVLRKELQEAAVSLSAYYVLRSMERASVSEIIRGIRSVNADYAKKPLWRSKRVGERGQPNSYVATGVKPMYQIT